ncbi:hypothetical protein OCU04_009019 [Sclerotinia nivalis]|uniref:NACHT domain-containing protein n=1 Tax=Sclerotinia nivalis TaxID=352851 RepID=A0A9X0AGM7_9HELO|nr:hypothetical protein OCU04_009019 [Sclerotinia nivalis]
MGSFGTNDPFQKCLDDFKKRLTNEELQDFQFSSLDDVKAAILKIQDDQSRRKSMMNLPRVKAFLEAFEQYEKIIEVFLNTSSILCFVWGPMKFCLQVASSWAESFDTLLDAYQQLAENIPLLSKYIDLFRSNQDMIRVAAMIYEDVLEFHRAALRIFSKPTWKRLFRATWKDFNSRFEHILKGLKQHKELVESQASVLHIQQYQIDQAGFRDSFKKVEEERHRSRRLALLNWLAATNSKLDQESAAAMRSDYPASGNWILHESRMKSWLDLRQSTIPILWMNGIPGAGKTILTSVIIEKCEKDSSVSTIYFYCKHGDFQRNTFVAISCSIITQLLKDNEVLLPYLYEECILSNSVSLVSNDLCTKLLEVCFGTIAKNTCLIIDGVDECELAQRKLLLSSLGSIIDNANSNRPGSLRALLVGEDSAEIRNTRWNEGMFLYAKLVLTNLYGQTTRDNLFEELQPGTFPAGFEQAYLRIATRIYQNPNDSERRTAEKLLGWITCAKRPMRWHEIQGAVAIDIVNEEFNFDGRRLRTHVADICGSLVEVLPGDRVQLVHVTAKS